MESKILAGAFLVLGLATQSLCAQQGESVVVTDTSTGQQFVVQPVAPVEEAPAPQGEIIGYDAAGNPVYAAPQQ